MNLPLVVTSVGRIRHIDRIAVPSRNGQFLALDDQLPGAHVDAALAPGLASRVGQMGELGPFAPIPLSLGDQGSMASRADATAGPALRALAGSPHAAIL